MATGTAPSQWYAETDAVLATVIDVLQEQHDAIQNRR